MEYKTIFKRKFIDLPALKIKTVSWGWRNGSVIKSTGCASRGPRFKSQHPHGCSPLPCNCNYNFSPSVSNTLPLISQAPTYMRAIYTHTLSVPKKPGASCSTCGFSVHPTHTLNSLAQGWASLLPASLSYVTQPLWLQTVLVLLLVLLVPMCSLKLFPTPPFFSFPAPHPFLLAWFSLV